MRKGAEMAKAVRTELCIAILFGANSPKTMLNTVITRTKCTNPANIDNYNGSDFKSKRPKRMKHYVGKKTSSPTIHPKPNDAIVHSPIVLQPGNPIGWPI